MYKIRTSNWNICVIGNILFITYIVPIVNKMSSGEDTLSWLLLLILQIKYIQKS